MTLDGSTSLPSHDLPLSRAGDAGKRQSGSEGFEPPPVALLRGFFETF